MILETFISPNFAISFSWRKTLAVCIFGLVTLMSRCKICKSCNCFSPLTSWMKIFHITYYGTCVFYLVCRTILEARSPLLAYSITILSIFHSMYHKDFPPSSRNACLYPIMFGCCIEAKMRISFNAFSFSFIERLAIFTRFRA